uniref:uncharacterized protein LOC120334488 n=1 Tax=Styela clava TaxID=7725 RepID=UPI001939B2EC|nr:uncharacterized protein LOC120334488 [Styela clava]
MAKIFEILLVVNMVILGFVCRSEAGTAQVPVEDEICKALKNIAVNVVKLIGEGKLEEAKNELDTKIGEMKDSGDLAKIKQKLEKMMGEGIATEKYVILTYIEGKLCPSEAGRAIRSIQTWAPKDKKNWVKFVEIMIKCLGDDL